MIQPVNYIIQMIRGDKPVYLKIDLDIPSMSLVSVRKEATVFESKSLVNGWLIKAQATYLNYRISVITL